PADFGEEPGATLLDRIKEITGGGARYGIDTTAIPAVVSQAMAALRPQGKLAALGLTFENYEISATDLLHGGKTLLSTIEGDSDPLTMVPQLLQLRAEGRFDVDPLVTTYPFAAINDAVADVASGKTVKAVLT